MRTVQNLTVGVYLDELFTRDELLKAGCFKESTLDKYVKKLVTLSSPFSMESKTTQRNPIEQLTADALGGLGQTTKPKSDFSGGIENLKFSLGFIKGCTVYTTYQLYLICWLQEKMKRRESINNIKLRLLRNEPEVLFNDDTMQNAVTQDFKKILIRVKEYRDNPNQSFEFLFCKK